MGIHRPRNVDWTRAAALLYGDWGTSKAYVIGAAFLVMAYSALPVILAVCALTALVGFNYILVCKHFPDGGGVYSSARPFGRELAVLGALLLVANLTVTASLSGWAALEYFDVPKEYLPLATMGVITLIGIFNFYGPKHTGSLAIWLAIPAVVVVVFIILLSAPHLTTAHLEPSHYSFEHDWTAFVSVILALSGVEAIANMTGVMKLDPGSTMAKPRVGKTASRAILVVLLEVVAATCLLGWAMLSLPPGSQDILRDQWEDMLSVLAKLYGEQALGPGFGLACEVVTSVVVGLLLLSAVNTAIVALIGLLYLLGRDGEMPMMFTRLNKHGVPWLAAAISMMLPVVVVTFSPNQLSLMELYALGVVGAITVNLGSCVFNPHLGLRWHERGIMALTTIVLAAVVLTLARTKPNALFFVVCVLIAGFLLRQFSRKRRGAASAPGARPAPSHAHAPAAEVPDALAPAPPLPKAAAILVAARGLTPVLRFALEEARLRGATLHVLYVRAVAVTLPGAPDAPEPTCWEDDPQAATIVQGVGELARGTGVRIEPHYTISDDPAGTIVEAAAEIGADLLILGASHRRALTHLLRGNIVAEVAANLPEKTKLLIHG